MCTAYLSLGSNLGDRVSTLYNAIRMIHSSAGRVEKISSIYESKSWGYESENNYLNCCLEISTALSPFQLLEEAQKIEHLMGRVRTSSYTDRVIDIDILFYDWQVIDEAALKIPHPYIADRAFVLLPLAEIAPEWYHNKLFLTIAQISMKYVHTQGVKCYKRVEKSDIIN